MAKRIGALWQKKKENRTYLTGNVEVVAWIKTPIIIFKNDKKEVGSKQPDWNIMLSEPRKEQEKVPVEKISADL